MMEEASDWSSTYKTLVEYHDLAYKHINEAINLNKEQKFTEAITQYEKGLTIIDKVLELNIECPRNPDFTFEKACSMVQKIKAIRKDVLCQIAECQTKNFSSIDTTDPPSYEEAVSSSSLSECCASSSNASGGLTNSSSLTYAELGTMLENLKININAQSVQTLFTCENVIIYHISSSGEVSATMEPDVLRVFQLEDGRKEYAPKYYIQIGVYIYPLVANVSPCYRADYGAIFFPNVEPTNAGEIIGLIIPQEQEDIFISLLEEILKVKLKIEKPTTTAAAVGTKISGYITSRANILSDCLVNGAHKAEQFLDSNTPKLIEKLNPSSKETIVSPKVAKGVKVAKNVTAKTADVTGFLATKVGVATAFLGKYLAPHVKKGGTKLLNAAGCAQDEASRKVDDIFAVTAGAIEGFTTIYQSLEVSATLLGNSLANNTVQVVKHKYGSSASKVTEDTFVTLGNSLQIANNVRIFKPNNIVTSTASAAFTNEKDGTGGESSGQQKLVVSNDADQKQLLTTSSTTQSSLTTGNNNSDTRRAEIESQSPDVSNKRKGNEPR